MNEPDTRPSFEKRLVTLEESMMHVEHTVKELNEVACSIQARLDKQQQTLDQLTETARLLSNRDVEKRTLEDDRPPHY